MICAFSFCEHDRLMALELSKHIEVLGGVSRHRCVLLHPFDTDAREIARHLKPAFESVQILTYPPRLNGWPDGPNQCFYVAAKAIEQMAGNEPWLWLEADCVPTRPEWMEQIYAEWKYCGMPILGALCNTFDLAGKVCGKHVTGVAVYPHDFYTKCPPLRTIVESTEQYRQQDAKPPAFDTYIAPYSVPMCGETQAIRHYWKSHSYKEKNGEVRCSFEIPYGISDLVDMTAAMIHGAKDFSLLDIVQARLCAA